MAYYAFRSYYSPHSQLGDMYEAKLGLNRSEVTWLNKFSPPVHTFMQIETAREATVRLFVAVMNQLEERCKKAGSTLPKRVRELVDATEEYDHVYNHQTYRYTNRSMAGHKVGAAIFLTIFHHCENTVRRHFAFRELDANFYYAAHNDPDQQFNLYFGDVLPSLLAPLVQTLPAPDLALEQALNQADPKRWQPRFEQLHAYLPAQPARFVEGIYALGEQNEHNPNLASIYQQAAWQLGATDPQATVGLYLHYLFCATRRHFKIKPLLKRMQKALFPLPEQLPRFEAIVLALHNTRDLPAALAAVPDIYLKERRKIALNPAAVRTARQQHAGTVELLNEYLRDDEPAPRAAPAPRQKPAKTAAPSATDAAALAPKVAAATLAAASNFAAGLALSDVQQALLQLFAAHHLTLPQTTVEAFAKAHGALRNQLIDSLNEASYELLDDILIEETDDAYTIYAPYYQRLIG